MDQFETKKVENYIKNLYEKLNDSNISESNLKPLKIFFNNNTPNGIPGDFCYSDGKSFYLGSIGDKGAVTIDKTNSLFELAYWVFKYFTATIAFEYERSHREVGKDIRRLAFQKQAELMEILGFQFKVKFEKDINELLIEYPFDDNLYK